MASTGDRANIVHASNRLSTAKMIAESVLENWSEFPDVDASSGELERAVELLGRVVSDLDTDLETREND